MTKITLIHNGRTRFVEIDLQLLRRHFEVTELFLRAKRHNPTTVVRQLEGQDLVLGWFASWHTFVPVLAARRMGIPTVLIVGGYDTADVPAADYGSQRGGLRRIVANTAMKNATYLVTNSESARNEAMRNVGIPGGKITVIYHGIPDVPLGNVTQRQRLVLNVGGVRRENLLRKGMLPFVQAAAYIPDARFMLVGKWYDDSINDLTRMAGPNVEFKGFVPDEELDELYARSAVYVQASLHEGFGMSVAEAMLAGCIPVVTRNGSLPEVVGDTGVFSASNDPQDIAAAVRQALTINGEARKRARARIIHEFPLSRREEKLCELLNSITVESR